MAGIDEEVEKMLEDCPILLDADFQRQHPGIVGIAGFLNSAAKTHYRMAGKYQSFDRFGINNIRDFLALIKQGNTEAIRTYERLRNTLCLE